MTLLMAGEPIPDDWADVAARVTEYDRQMVEEWARAEAAGRPKD